MAGGGVPLDHPSTGVSDATGAAGTAAGAEVRVSSGASTVNEPPVADAGRKKFVEEDERATLRGDRSYDPDGDELGYQWRQVTDYDVTMLGENSDVATVRVHNISRPVDAEFELEVTDENGASDTDRVTVEVEDVDTPTPTPTPTPTATPYLTPYPTPTATVSPTPSPTPPSTTAAPTPTATTVAPTPTATPSPTPTPTPTDGDTPTATGTPTESGAPGDDTATPTPTAAGPGSSSDGLLGGGIGRLLVVAVVGVGALALVATAGGVWWLRSDDSDESGGAGQATDDGPGVSGSSTAVRTDDAPRPGGGPDSPQPGDSGPDDSPVVGSPSSAGGPGGQHPGTADAGGSMSPVGERGGARGAAGQSSNTRIYDPKGGDADVPTEPPDPDDEQSDTADRPTAMADDTDERVEEPIDRGDDRREDAQEYLSSGEFDRALEALEAARDAYETASRTATEHGLAGSDRAERKLAEIDDERRTVLERQVGAIAASVRTDLDDAEASLAAGEDGAAGDALDEVAARLDTARTLVAHHGLDDLDDDIGSLEERLSGLRQRLDGRAR